jgi:hypothetical protein
MDTSSFLLILLGIVSFIGGAVWLFMVSYEAGYDHGYQSGKRNFTHALRSEASRVFEN